MHRRTRLTCHCEEQSDVAISGRQLRFRRWLSHDAAGYGEIAPQGHFLALRAQGATSACGLLAMTNLWLSPFYRQPVPISSIAPGPAVRSPTYYTYAKNQGQAIGLPLCFVLLQLRVAHEDGRELCAGGVAGRLEAAVLAVDDARTDAPAQRVNSP